MNFDAAPSILRWCALEATRSAPGMTTGDEVLLFKRPGVAADFERRIGELHPGDVIRGCAFAATALSTRCNAKVGSQEKVEFDVKDVDM